jgi:hypothetical protein
MSTFFVEANGTPMGEYVADSASEALDLYARGAGYPSYADVAELFGDDATASRVDTVALALDVENALNTRVFQDHYGDGVALVFNASVATFDDLAKFVDKRVWDYVD